MPRLGTFTFHAKEPQLKNNGKSTTYLLVKPRTAEALNAISSRENNGTRVVLEDTCTDRADWWVWFSVSNESNYSFRLNNFLYFYWLYMWNIYKKKKFNEFSLHRYNNTKTPVEYHTYEYLYNLRIRLSLWWESHKKILKLKFNERLRLYGVQTVIEYIIDYKLLQQLRLTLHAVILYAFEGWDLEINIGSL